MRARGVTTSLAQGFYFFSDEPSCHHPRVQNRSLKKKTNTFVSKKRFRTSRSAYKASRQPLDHGMLPARKCHKLDYESSCRLAEATWNAAYARISETRKVGFAIVIFDEDRQLVDFRGMPDETRPRRLTHTNRVNGDVVPLQQRSERDQEWRVTLIDEYGFAGLRLQQLDELVAAGRARCLCPDTGRAALRDAGACAAVLREFVTQCERDRPLADAGDGKTPMARMIQNFCTMLTLNGAAGLFDDAVLRQHPQSRVYVYDMVNRGNRMYIDRYRFASILEEATGGALSSDVVLLAEGKTQLVLTKDSGHTVTVSNWGQGIASHAGAPPQGPVLVCIGLADASGSLESWKYGNGYYPVDQFLAHGVPGSWQVSGGSA